MYFFVKIRDWNGYLYKRFDCNKEIISLRFNLFDITKSMSNHAFTIPLNYMDEEIPLDYIVELWVINNGIESRIYSGFHRTSTIENIENGRSLYTSYGSSIEDLLDIPILYPDNTAASVKNGFAEAVMKDIVRENCTYQNTSNIYKIIYPNFYVEDTLNIGKNVSEKIAWNNLLSILRKIATESYLKFRIIDKSTDGQYKFVFEVFDPDSVSKFKIRDGTVYQKSFTYSNNRNTEVNTSIVIDNKTDSNREFVIKQDENLINSSPYYQRKTKLDTFSHKDGSTETLESTALFNLINSNGFPIVSFVPSLNFINCFLFNELNIFSTIILSMNIFCNTEVSINKHITGIQIELSNDNPTNLVVQFDDYANSIEDIFIQEIKYIKDQIHQLKVRET